MHPLATQLLIVQNRDQELQAIRMELARIPVEEKRLDDAEKSAAAKLQEVQKHLKDLEVRRKNQELEALGKKDQLSRFKTQQMQTKKNEEYQALAHEIVHTEHAIVGLEDEELRIMEEVELSKQAAVEAQAHWQTQADELKTRRLALAEKTARLKERQTEVETDRAQQVEGISHDILHMFDRIFANKKDAALVPLEHENCGGCHMRVAATTVLALKQLKDDEARLVNCDQCGRFLYLQQ
ncbi:MAG: zinc ribbon domain-containing protein [Verrucomicrobiales bacterium]